jgi:hypothetical protein
MLARNNPILASRIPKLSQIPQMTPSTSPKKSCNCGGKQNITTPDANKQATENILSSLDAADFQNIKNVLALDELCYYRRNVEQNKLEMVCI